MYTIKVKADAAAEFTGNQESIKLKLTTANQTTSTDLYFLWTIAPYLTPMSHSQ